MLTFDRVFCKKLQSDDAGFLVFTEEDVNCCVDITSTKDFKYMTVNSNTRTSSEEGFFIPFLIPNALRNIYLLLFCIDLSYFLLIRLQVFVMESDNVREGLWPIRKRVDKVQYFLEHHNGFFYILTNAPVNDTEMTNEGYYLARCRAEKSLVDRWQVCLFPVVCQ